MLAITRKQIADFQTTFTLIDENRDGYVSTTELNPVMYALGQKPTKAEYKDMINEVDADGNGTIDFPEFLTIMIKKINEVILYAFKSLADASGFIPANELNNIMENLGGIFSKEDVNKIIKQVDIDKDGQINYMEFTELLNILTSNPM